MKIFVFIPSRNYTFGSTLVAANSVEEAQKVLETDGVYLIRCYRVKFQEVLEGITAEGQPRIVHSTSGME